jgi:hypothetical protein
MRRNDEEFIGLKEIRNLMQAIIPEKSSSPSVHYPRDITIIRSFIYSLVCGENSGKIAPAAFLAGCNRFGIDNPGPIITKRLSCYGNPEELEKDFKRLAERYREIVPEANIDPDIYTNAEVRGVTYEETTTKKPSTYKDFGETLALSPVKKFSGIQDF